MQANYNAALLEQYAVVLSMQAKCEYVQLQYIPLRSVQPSRSNYEFLYVPRRSIYIPYTFLNVFFTFCPNVIRSYTFRATLSLKTNFDE